MAAPTTDRPPPDADAVPAHPVGRRGGHGPLVVAGLASVGAGAIHVAAIGAHDEHRRAVVAFTLLAIVQLGWGAVAVVGRHRLLGLGGVVVGGASLGGWLLAKTSGIGFVDGLGASEPIQRSDALAAALALVVLVLGLRAVAAGGRGRVPGRALVGATAVVVLLAAIVGAAGADAHDHAGHGSTADADHAHGGAGSGAAAFDPARPVDLADRAEAAGATPAERGRAERLLSATIERSARFADRAAAEAAGYRSVGDGSTGFEHLVDAAALGDGHVLDPEHPEALVYAVVGGERSLVAVLYLLDPGTRLQDAPALGGSLTPFVVRDDLCRSAGPHPQVAGLASAAGECRPPATEVGPVPSLHVWVADNRCGPFSASEAAAAGPGGDRSACTAGHGG